METAQMDVTATTARASLAGQEQTAKATLITASLIPVSTVHARIRQTDTSANVCPDGLATTVTSTLTNVNLTPAYTESAKMN